MTESRNKTGYYTVALMALLLLAAIFCPPALFPVPEEPAGETARYENRQEAQYSDAAPHGERRKTLSEQALAEINGIAREMILYYGCYGAKADQKINELLDAISEIDGGEGVAWKTIMERWKYVNDGLKIHTSVPKGLPEDDSLCIVVLGYELNADGSMSGELKGRLKTALRCAQRYPEAFVLCTGGGTARRNKSATEGGVMTEWMISRGIAKDRLLTEDQSKTTTENAVFCHEILRRECPQVDSVLLVTSSYHMPWGVLMFEAEFLRAAQERNTSVIRVVSNCAYPKSSVIYGKGEAMRWQTGGMLELIGEKELADVFYSYRYKSYIRNKKPKL